MRKLLGLTARCKVLAKWEPSTRLFTLMQHCLSFSVFPSPL
jgi:hypothetical protein